MNAVTSSSRPLPRRAFLRGAGVTLALPLLNATRSMARGPEPRAADPDQPTRRMLCICTNMGMMPQFFWPGGDRDYVPSPYLKVIEQHRDDFTVFSGVSHPDVDGGHKAEISFLTAAPHPGSGGFRNSISLDQYAAERIGTQTRFPSLSLVVGSENNSLSWTAAGIKIPAENKPSDVFRKLFVQGSPNEVNAQIQQLRDGRSVLDAVMAQARRVQARLGASDREKLDQYFSSIRELEHRLLASEAWQQRPKPRVEIRPPADILDPAALIERTRLMYKMSVLALQTDSTRVIALMIDQNANPKVNLPGVAEGHHSLTHHGQRDGSIQQLKIIETAQFEVFGELLGELKGAVQGGRTLLEDTMVLYGSNLGNGNSHDNKNLPMILAGGGFRHGGQLVFDPSNNYPLPNLYVSMLQRLGVETDRFASSTGTLRGLEFAS